MPCGGVTPFSEGQLCEAFSTKPSTLPGVERTSESFGPEGGDLSTAPCLSRPRTKFENFHGVIQLRKLSVGMNISDALSRHH